IVAPHIGWHGRVDPLPVTEEHAVDDALHIHRVVDGLAHALVRDGPALDLGEAEVDDAAARYLLYAHRLRPRELLQLVRRDVDDEIGLARLESGDARSQLRG